MLVEFVQMFVFHGRLEVELIPPTGNPGKSNSVFFGEFHGNSYLCICLSAYLSVNRFVYLFILLLRYPPLSSPALRPAAERVTQV